MTRTIFIVDLRHVGSAFRRLVVLPVALSAVVLWLGGLGHVATAEGQGPTRYDGRTLDEWRERIKQLHFRNPDIGREVPGLLAIVEDEDAPWFSRRQAALTLARIGAPAVEATLPVLLPLLSDASGDPEQSPQLWAIKAVALFGPLAGDAAPELVRVLQDEAQPALPRLAAIEALGRIGPTRPEVVPAIISALDAGLQVPDGQSDTLERAIAAAEMFELFGGHASSAVPSLIRATLSPSVRLRRAAANTLGLIGPAADPAIPALVDLVLLDESREVQDLAARALGLIGAAAEPTLVQLLGDPDPEVRARAAAASGELPTFAPQTRQALEQAVADEDALVRMAALESLWRVEAEPELVAVRAISELENRDREIRMRAVLLLESMGKVVQPWIPAVKRLADDERRYVADAAARVLDTYASNP